MRRRAAGLAIVWLSGAFTGHVHAREANIATHPSSLWDAIDSLTPRSPLRPARIEAALGTTLRLTARGGNEYFDLYESVPVALADGVIVANVDLRIAREGEHPGFMVLELGGRCITLEMVRDRYGDLRITGFPRGRSMDEATAHASARTWGTLTFGFAERKPDCLAWIAFDPAKRLPP